MTGLPVVLTLDLASTTGWCLGRLGEPPRYGAWFLGSGTYGRRFAVLADRLAKILDGPERPNEIVFESPMNRQQKTAAVARVLLGCVAMTEYVAERFAVRISEEHVGKTRRIVLGQGGFRRGEDTKAAVDRLCQMHGWHIPQDDARDAFVLWQHVQLVRVPRLAKIGSLGLELAGP